MLIIILATHRRRTLDLRNHRLTQTYRNPKYTVRDLAYVAREASKRLGQRRAQIIQSSKKRSIPLPGCTKGKQKTKIGGPRQMNKHGPSSLSIEVDMNGIGDVSAEDHDEMREFWERLCDFGGSDTETIEPEQNTYINWSNDEEVEVDGEAQDGQEAEDDVAIAGFSTTEPDDYDIEMAKAFDSIEPEGSKGQGKRKWESVSTSEEAPADISVPVDHEQKRRKLEIATIPAKASTSAPKRKVNKRKSGNLQPHYLFCRSSSLAAVFEAALAAEVLEPAQEESSNTPKLDSLDLELLGEEPSDSKQTQSKESNDLKLTLAEALYPSVGHDDLRVAIAASNFMGILQESSNVGPQPDDRDALKRAFGSADELQQSAEAKQQPSPTTVMAHTATLSDRCVINKRLIIENGYGDRFKRHGKKTGPSKNFQSFFATRRLRKDLLRQDRALWSDDDASFIVSGKMIEEPGAELGAEFAAKRLLDVSDTTPSTQEEDNPLTPCPGPQIATSKDCA